jgi:hypothetical protein
MKAESVHLSCIRGRVRRNGLDARTPASQAGLENRTRWRACRVDQRWSALPRKKVFTAAESKRYILDSITRPS